MVVEETIFRIKVFRIKVIMVVKMEVEEEEDVSDITMASFNVKYVIEWGTLHPAVFLINRMPNAVLGGQVPFEALYKVAVDYSLLKNTLIPNTTNPQQEPSTFSNTHPMITRAKNGIYKLKACLVTQEETELATLNQALANPKCTTDRNDRMSYGKPGGNNFTRKKDGEQSAARMGKNNQVNYGNKEKTPGSENIRGSGSRFDVLLENLDETMTEIYEKGEKWSKVSSQASKKSTRKNDNMGGYVSTPSKMISKQGVVGSSKGNSVCKGKKPSQKLVSQVKENDEADNGSVLWHFHKEVADFEDKLLLRPSEFSN
ncbi:hypothetical protein EZV62_024034 [Acer yangbiense]|uniref:Uncharacterized protein n=1 Tax=Acer yangbiense TaxID=1000413 RepID=A0A5C7H3D4_9ROSI|nr:hypothetical protein EZV62_024034 [Acer yangbiense]